MLKYLKIRNLAVIHEAELEVESAFICLTGESGAGKSVLVDALLLLAGGRASADLVRTGSDKSVIEAEFELDRQVEELPLLEDGQLFLRREITREGKSRAFVNGALVPNGVLQQYAETAFEIHGQHGQQRLLKAKNHLDIFDEQTGIMDQRRAFEEKLTALKQDLREYAELKAGEAQRLKEIDFIHMQIGEIEAVNPSGEDADLDARLHKARNAETIRANRIELNELLNDRLAPDLERVGQLVRSLSEFEPTLAPYGEQVETLAATLEDLRGETESADEGFEVENPLPALEARENELNRLFMKYGRDVEEVLAELDRLKSSLAETAAASQSLGGRWRRLQRDYQALGAQRQALHQARERAAAAFEKEVERNFADLSLRSARFRVENKWADWPGELTEEPVLAAPAFQFLLSSNLGEPLKPLTKVASGGELSRVLLSLISAFKRPSSMLLVFDEIDAGLGGETAHAVGAKLATLGRTHQVMCVTHFAQVARFAAQQIKLEKRERAGRTFVGLAVCDYDQRVAELARLMGGDADSESLREHARSLIQPVG